MKIAIANWSKYQHYKDRDPQWVKLYRNLLTKYEFMSLPTGSKALIMMLWLLAAEFPSGVIDLPQSEVAYRLRMPQEELLAYLEALVTNAFVILDPRPDEIVDPADWPSRYVSDELRNQVFERDGNECVWCGSKENLETDHIVPTSKGGKSELSNLQVLCRPCNRKKRSRTGESAEQVATQVRSLEKRREENINQRREEIPVASSAAPVEIKSAPVAQLEKSTILLSSESQVQILPGSLTLTLEPPKSKTLDPRKAIIREEIKAQHRQRFSLDAQWDSSEEVAVNALLKSLPQSVSDEHLRRAVRHKYLSADIASGRPRAWIRRLMDYFEAPLNEFGKPNHVSQREAANAIRANEGTRRESNVSSKCWNCHGSFDPATRAHLSADEQRYCSDNCRDERNSLFAEAKRLGTNIDAVRAMRRNQASQGGAHA